jgi:hypothetical protein
VAHRAAARRRRLVSVAESRSDRSIRATSEFSLLRERATLALTLFWFLILRLRFLFSGRSGAVELSPRPEQEADEATA